MCKQSGNTQTVVQNPQVPDWLSNQFQNLATRAADTSNRPFNPGVQRNVADFAPDQLQAFQQVRQDQGIYQPYMDAATGYAQLGGSPIAAGQIARYGNPFQNMVIDSTLANIQQNNALQAANLRGNAALQGGLGNDRLGVAQAELARNQNLATNQTLATLNAQNYNQALGAAQQDRTAAQQAAGQFSSLGSNVQSMANRDAAALLQTGGLQQALSQQQLDTTSGNIAQQEQYPFATASWLGGMLQGASPTFTGSTQTTTTPGPSALSQIAGLGMLGYGLFGSDRRMKIDLGVVGELNDGTPVHAYRYRDDPEGRTHFGPMADDVAKTNPEAVREVDGMLYVNPDKIAEHQKTIDDVEYEDVTERDDYNSGGFVVPGTYSVDKQNIIRMSGGQPGQMTPYGTSNTVPQQSMSSGAMLQVAPIKRLPTPKSRSQEMYDDAKDIAHDMRGMQMAGQGLAGIADQGMRGLGGVSMRPFQSYGPPVPAGLADGGRVGYFMGGLAMPPYGAQPQGMPTPYGASNVVPVASPQRAQGRAPVAGGASPAGLGAVSGLPDVLANAQDGPGTTGLNNPTGAMYGPPVPAGLAAASDARQTIAGAQGSNSLFGGTLSDPVRQGIIQAGLGMLSGSSPHAMVNIGRGGAMGMQAYTQAVAAEQRKAQEALQNRIAEQKLQMLTEEYKQRQAELDYKRQQDTLDRARQEKMDAIALAKAERDAREPGFAERQRLEIEQKIKEKQELENYWGSVAERQGLQRGTPEYNKFVLERISGDKSRDTRFGLNPIYGTRTNPQTGQKETVMLQAGDNATAAATALPPDVTVNSGYDRVDAGTHEILIDKATRQPIATIPKNVGAAAAERAAGQKVGESVGQAQVDLAKVESDAESVKKYIEAVRNHNDLGRVTGQWGGWLPNVSEGANDAQSRIDQLKGRTFLAAFESLKGAGQITEVEGARASDALARLQNQRVGTEQYIQALNDFESEVNRLLENARKKAAGRLPQSQLPAPNADGATTDNNGFKVRVK